MCIYLVVFDRSAVEMSRNQKARSLEDMLDNLDRKLFSKIRSNPQCSPKKQTAPALAIALRLNVDKTLDLLKKAGFSLSDGRKQDAIVRYFLGMGTYDMFTINEALFCFGEPLLGA